MIGEVGRGGHPDDEDGRDEQHLLAPGELRQRFLDRPERVSRACVAERHLGDCLEQVGMDIRIDVASCDLCAPASSSDAASVSPRAVRNMTRVARR